MALRAAFRKGWHFLWHDDSLLSWLINFALAFVLVKFVLYPGIGFLLDTSYPVVAVVSGSMEHRGLSFAAWWEATPWYRDHQFTQEQFSSFPFSHGFNKGDIMVLRGVQLEDVAVGDVLVYESPRHAYPIIHRVVAIRANGDPAFQTKGDNNMVPDQELVQASQIERTGKAIFRIPFLGWIKIGFVSLLEVVLP